MSLVKLTNEHAKVVDILVDYWKSRGMSKFDEKWASEFLTEGHKKEIKQDEFFVYKIDEEVVGTVSLVTDISNVAEIRDMVVKTEHRKKGYGRKMLTELLNYAKELKIRKVFAFVVPNLAEKLKAGGFEQEGLLKSHFAKDEDLVIMSKFL